MTKRTFLDTGVLIAAYRADHSAHEAALKIIQDDSRAFVSSDLVKLELLPQAIHHKQTEELEFYNLFFNNVDVRNVDNNSLRDGAYQLASNYGLAACDAIHADTAINSSVAEFITTEKPTKPFFKIPPDKITSISIYQNKARPSRFRQFLLCCKKLFS